MKKGTARRMLFTAALLLAAGAFSAVFNAACSKAAEMDAVHSSASGLWEGTGYNPEGPSGIEGQTPPEFKDMSNLYGRESAAPETAQTGELAAQRKLIKRANVRIRVEDLSAADGSITALMEQYGAYSEMTEINEDSRRYTVRLPDAAYTEFLAAMSGMGRTLYRSENAEDVTVRYYDLEGRLATKRELLKTYQSYLGKAKNIEEILSVEERIAGLQGEIDGTGKELRRLANMVDYATVTLHIFGPVAAAPYRGPTLGERLKEMFSAFGKFLSTIALVITGIVIYGVPLVLLLAAAFWLFFGRIGLVKKLWRFAAGKKAGVQSAGFQMDQKEGN